LGERESTIYDMPVNKRKQRWCPAETDLRLGAWDRDTSCACT
jgi:hypothetical protein